MLAIASTSTPLTAASSSSGSQAIAQGDSE
jgi:hypothetical protein